jgi:serine/threonine protein kinase
LQSRIISLLDETWRPGANDTIDKYILYLPLATSNFYALITSNASREIRAELFAQVLEGLAFLHENGISHRDIKPGNLAVISFDPPQAKILDFGSATIAPKTLYDSPGTVTYLAPEQKAGQYHDCCVDYWAVALVGLEILKYRLCGRIGKDQFAIIHTWLDDYDRVRGLHPITQCCRSMLQWESQERMRAADALSILLADYRYNPNLDGKRNAGSLDRKAKKSASEISLQSS